MRFLPLLLGFITVGQGVFNRLVGERWGLSAAVVFNACVLLCASSTILLMVRAQPQWFPSYFTPVPSLQTFRWWFLLPGLLGCLFITGIPWAISRLGAAQVFVLVVAGQMAASLGYDALFEGRPVTLARLGGAALAVCGALLLTLGSSSPPSGR